MRGFLLSFALLAGGFSGAVAARPVVAIIDSGVARTPELQSVVIAEHDMAGARPAFQPRYDHGTMVATILTREAKGAVDIVSFRIDDPAGCPAGAAPPCQYSPVPVAQAIRKATELDVDAINISLTLQDDASIVAAIRDAAAQGITVVLAAGNDGFDHPGNLRMARAAGTQAVLVGAVDAAGNPWAKTNRPHAGATSDYTYVWRLGVDVPTASALGAPVFGTGTSFAAPIETARRLTEAAPVLAGGAQPVQAAATGSVALSLP